MRLIDADKLMRHLSDWALHDNAPEIRECMKAVEEQPTVDTSKELVCSITVDTDEIIERIKERGWEPVKHGRWKPFDLTWGRSIYYCTSCGGGCEVPTEMGNPKYDYCPNCGAYMKGEQDEAD